MDILTADWVMTSFGAQSHTSTRPGTAVPGFLIPSLMRLSCDERQRKPRFQSSRKQEQTLRNPSLFRNFQSLYWHTIQAYAGSSEREQGHGIWKTVAGAN